MNWSRKLTGRSASILLPGLVLAGVVATQANSAQAAAPNAVVINELMYNPATDLDTDEFLELANTTSSAVDMSGWTFTAGITATLPAGAIIPPNGFYVLAADATRFQTLYGRTANAVYTGKLSNSGETVTLADATSTTVDSVTYATDNGWPVTPDGLGPVSGADRPALDHNDPLNWAASTSATGNTAGAREQRRALRARSPRSRTDRDPGSTRGEPGRDGHRHHDWLHQFLALLPRRLRQRGQRPADVHRRRRLHGHTAGRRAPGTCSATGCKPPTRSVDQEPTRRRHDRLPGRRGAERRDQRDPDHRLVHPGRRLHPDGRTTRSQRS